MNFNRSNRRFTKLLTAIVAVMLLSLTAFAQKADPKDPKNTELAAQLIKQAIEARGGARYLSFKTLEAQGQFTPFDKGAPANPAPFTDWIVYPEKERVDFGKGRKKNRKIQVNIGKTG